MENSEKLVAWLEGPFQEQWAVGGNCSIGRAAANQIVLRETKVSRRHALLHCQGSQEYWLVDLGSSNGTYLNGRRVSQPTLLRDRDQITIGDTALRFRQPNAESVQGHTLSEATITDIRQSKCWLMVADMIGSTTLSRELSPEQFSVVTGQWLAGCKEIVERHKGVINKYLGDGFFAFWETEGRPSSEVVGALMELKAFQGKSNPPFRVVVHHGDVAFGGKASLGEESLLGREVNYVFRLEKVGGALGERCVLSDAANALLREHITSADLGAHAVPGFTEKETLFKF